MTNPAALFVRPARRSFVSAACVGLSAFLGFTGSAYAEPAYPKADAITVDGAFDDWDATNRGMITGDGAWIYARLPVSGVDSLQAGSRVRTLMLDVDGDARTGRRMNFGELTLGVDAEVSFSPARGGNGNDVGNGLSVTMYTPEGDAVEKGHADLDLHFAPTFASDEYELRLSRFADEGSMLAERLERGVTLAAAWVERVSPGEFTQKSMVARVVLPRRTSDERTGRDTDIPAKPRGAVRVVSYNVLFASPVQNPEPFARVLSALEPDVVLVQEWDGRNGNPDLGAEDLAEWFNRHVPLSRRDGGDGWHAMTSAGWGVAIVSRRPLDRIGPERLNRDGGDNSADRALRYVGATTETPAGPIAVSCVHYKCCGSPGSREDRTRIEEARAVNKVLANVLTAPDAPRLRLIAGDFNLVGTRTPLDVTGELLDVDGTDMVPVELRVLGDGSAYTWRDSGSRFAPGRLDWTLLGDAGAEVLNAFVLDTGRLSRRVLGQHGLEADDSTASDHKPMVVDLRPR